MFMQYICNVFALIGCTAEAKEATKREKNGEKFYWAKTPKSFFNLETTTITTKKDVEEENEWTHRGNGGNMYCSVQQRRKQINRRDKAIENIKSKEKKIRTSLRKYVYLHRHAHPTRTHTSNSTHTHSAAVKKKKEIVHFDCRCYRFLFCFFWRMLRRCATVHWIYILVKGKRNA